MNISRDISTLEAMNTAEVEKLIPTIVFLLIVCVVGIVGNSLVIHVYRTRFKMSNSKCFILCLSAVDLLTCCIAIPLEVGIIQDQYTFEALWLCKTSRVFNTLGTISSSFILLFIAVDRFRKVCKPFGWQIETSVAKFLCGLALFFGTMVSWPAIFVYGKHTFDIPEYNITGTECSTSDEVIDTKLPFYYALVFGFMFVAGIIAMSILYCFIGHKVRNHVRKMSETFGKNMSIPMTSSVIDTCDTKLDETETDDMKQKDFINGDSAVKYSKKGEILFEEAETEDFKSEVSPTLSEEISLKKKSVFSRVSSISGRLNSNVVLRTTTVTGANTNSNAGTLKRTQFLKQASARKTAFLMFVVSIGFILSFLPHLLLMLIRQIKSDFVDELSETNKAVYKFFLRSYFLNSAINPVIYRICDSRFKFACKEIFRRCFGGTRSRGINV